MRRVPTLAVIALAVVLGPVALASANAATRVEHGNQALVDDNPDTQNPCTGDIGDLVNDERDSWTVATRSDGSYLIRGHSVADITFTPYDDTAPTYTGHEMFSSVETVTRGADGFRSSQRSHATGTDGHTLVLVDYVHVTTGPDGTIHVDHQSSSLTCG